ncbi:MAG: hypothetical protein M1836_005267 [Candelina mexicana]|nr:MAG: hypothetical protein M1836_005267 [Candelina mexicana]
MDTLERSVICEPEVDAGLNIQHEKSPRAIDLEQAAPRSINHPKEDVPPLGGLSFLDRFLVVWIILAMALGIILGNLVPSTGPALQKGQFVGVSIPIAVGLLVMMYPILCKVRFETLHLLLRERSLWVQILFSFVLNWIFAPLLMVGLAWAFLPDRTDLREGLIFVGVARCIAMVLIWTDLAGGDGDYCAVLVAFNSILQIVLFAPLAVFYIKVVSHSKEVIGVDYSDVATSVAVFLGIPLAAAIMTRLSLRSLLGERKYQTHFIRFIAPLSLIGLIFTIIVLFASQGKHVVQQITSVLRVAAPLIVYFAIVFAATVLLCRRFGFGYRVSCTQSFTAASNNFELAIAVVVAVYGTGSGQALASTVGPLIEVPVLVGLVLIQAFQEVKAGKAIEMLIDVLRKCLPRVTNPKKPTNGEDMEAIIAKHVDKAVKEAIGDAVNKELGPLLAEMKALLGKPDVKVSTGIEKASAHNGMAISQDAYPVTENSETLASTEGPVEQAPVEQAPVEQAPVEQASVEHQSTPLVPTEPEPPANIQESSTNHDMSHDVKWIDREFESSVIKTPDPFIRLLPRNSDAAKSFFDQTGFYCQIDIDDGTILPRKAAKNWSSISLRACIPGGDVKQRLTLEAIVEKKNTCGIYQEAKLEFYPAGTHGFPNHIDGLTIEAIPNEPKSADHASKDVSGKATEASKALSKDIPKKAERSAKKFHSILLNFIGMDEATEQEDPPSWQGVIVVSFYTLGGIGHGLLQRRAGLDPDTNKLLDILHNLTAPAIAKSQTPHKPRKVVLRLRVVPQRGDWDSLNEQAALRAMEPSKNEGDPPKNESDPSVTPFGDQLSANLVWESLHSCLFPKKPFLAYCFLDGEPSIQHGRLKTRQLIQKRSQLIQYPPENVLIDRDESVIYNAYGAYLEHLFHTDKIAQLCENEHEIGFVHLQRRLIMAKVRLRSRDDRHGQSIRIDHKTVFNLTVKVRGAEIKALGIVTDNVFQMEDCDILMHIFANRQAFLDAEKPLAVGLGQKPTMHPVEMRPQANNQDILRQMNANRKIHQKGKSHPKGKVLNIELSSQEDKTFNMLKGQWELQDPTANEPWIPLILNQNLLDTPTQTINEICNLTAPISESVLNRAKATVLKYLNWTDEQRKFLDNGEIFLARGRLLVGPGGTGKTSLIAATVIFYYMIGGSVMVSAPSKDAVDNIFTSILKFCEDHPEDSAGLDPTRVYRSVDETAALRKTSPEVEDDFAEGQNIETELESLAADMASTGELLSTELEVAFSSRAARFLSLLHVLAHSLYAKTKNRALRKDPLDVLMMSYPETDDEGRLVDPSTLELVDMWEEFRKYLQMLEKAYDTWKPEERRKLGTCWKACRDEVMKVARCIVTTNGSVGAEYIRQYFGMHANFVVVIQDECQFDVFNHQIEFVKDNCFPKIAGIVMCGDPHQLAPVVVSHNERINEFAPQIANSWFVRLLAEGYPATVLRIQHRMTPEIALFPSLEAYGHIGRLQNAESTKNREPVKDMDNFLKKYFNIDKSEFPLLLIDVEDGIERVNPFTKSKFNIENCNIGTDIVMQYWKEYKDMPDIVIMVPYAQQKHDYDNRLIQVARDANVSRSRFPRVRTIDSFIGNEANIIIYDTVVTKSLGFQRNKPRVTVALTRAKMTMIILGSREITNTSEMRRWRDYIGDNRGIMVENPKPMFIRAIENVASRGLVLSREGANLTKKTFGLRTEPGKSAK